MRNYIDLFTHLKISNIVLGDVGKSVVDQSKELHLTEIHWNSFFLKSSLLCAESAFSLNVLNVNYGRGANNNNNLLQPNRSVESLSLKQPNEMFIVFHRWRRYFCHHLTLPERQQKINNVRRAYFSGTNERNQIIQISDCKRRYTNKIKLNWTFLCVPEKQKF